MKESQNIIIQIRNNCLWVTLWDIQLCALMATVSCTQQVFIVIIAAVICFQKKKILVGFKSTAMWNTTEELKTLSHFSGCRTNLCICSVFALTACSTIWLSVVVALVRWRMARSTQSLLPSFCLQESSMMWPLMAGRPKESTGLIRNGRSAADL